MIKIAPSILSADFSKLGKEIDSISDADYIHFDVMDGTFVPNITIGQPVLSSVRKYTDKTLDVHLMIDKPIRFVREFCEKGADIVVFHHEADSLEQNLEALKIIRDCGKKAGIALRPNTPAEVLLPYFDYLDMILVMTVEPGFGGQSFMHHVLPKIAAVREYINSSIPKCELEIDGGVNPETAKLCIEAGANVLVAGSNVFKASDRNAQIKLLRG